MLRRPSIALGLLVLLLGAAVVLRLVVGGERVLSWPEDGAFLEIRLLRVVAGLVVGASLAMGGVMMQSLLRNPLASPDILGLSAGAGLAVMLAIYLRQALGSSSGAGAAPTWGAWQAGPALVGSMAALLLVYSLSQRRGLVEPTALVLIGVVVSIMCGAGIMLVQHLMPGRAENVPGGASRLLIGALSDEVTWRQLAWTGAVAAAGLVIGVRLGPTMDAAALGQDEAMSVGVPVGALRLGLLVTSGVLTAAAVVVAGPIGFVGLVCPHAVRMLTGARGGGGMGGHRVLIAGSAMAGAALVNAGDALVKAIETPAGRIPLGVVMALVGGTTFIALLRAERAR